MTDTAKYTGYLSPFVERIRAMDAAGAGTGEIATALFELGARADTSNPSIAPRKMPRAHHVKNLRLMVLHVLQRLGLRARRKRVPRWQKQPAAGSYDQI